MNKLKSVLNTRQQITPYDLYTVSKKNKTPAKYHSPSQQPFKFLTILLFLLTTLSATADPESSNETRGTLYSINENERTEMLLLSTEIEVQITGIVSRVNLKQTFFNNTTTWREGIYVFPLPDEAAVDKMSFTIGERRIIGQIKERQQAKKIYNQAKKQGKKTSLVEQERPNLFTNTIANIGPNEKVIVDISYLDIANYEHGAFNLRLPLTMTPRYNPGNPIDHITQALSHISLDSTGESSKTFINGSGWGSNTDQVTDAARITPPISNSEAAPLTTIRVALNIGMPLDSISSTSHLISTQEDSTGDNASEYVVTLKNTEEKMDQDFILQWTPHIGTAPTAAVFKESTTTDDYALIMIMPPQPGQAIETTQPREVIYIIDTSGSMGGESIRQARQALLFALTQHQPQDYFNIIQFNSTPKALFDYAMPATPYYLYEAREFITQLQADGGTEMSSALTMGLNSHSEIELSDSAIRQVIFITDGSVGNEVSLFNQIQRDINDARLFTVGIGSAPNAFFMRKAAQFGRGTYTYISDTHQVKDKISLLTNKLTSAIATNIEIEWPTENMDSYPKKIPDLYRGEPLIITTKSSHDELLGQLAITGLTGEKEWRRNLTISTSNNNSGIKTLWARRKIENLMDQRVLGGDKKAIKNEITQLGLQHNIVTKHTSFVAVEEHIDRPKNEPLKRDVMKNALPAGSSSIVNLPRGATHGPLFVMSGMLLLLTAFGLIIFFTIQQEDKMEQCG